MHHPVGESKRPSTSGLRQSPFFTWYSDLSQSPTPGDWFRLKLDGDQNTLNNPGCVVEWELYTYDWINGVVALNPQTSSSSTGHQMTWVSPPWPYTTTPVAAVWFLNVNVTFGNNTWRHPVYYVKQPEMVVPLGVNQFTGTVLTQSQWDAGINRANEIYKGSAIRFLQDGALNNVGNTGFIALTWKYTTFSPILIA